MPLLVFAGVGGGAGTSTVAAATALRLVERGSRVLFLSLGANNLLIPTVDHVLPPARAAQPVPPAQPVSVAPGLDALGLDPQTLLAEAWGDAEATVSGLLQRGGLEPIVEAELPTLPGVSDVLSVLALARLLASSQWDVVVLDGGQAADMLRLLALPEAARWYLRRMLPLGLGLAKAFRPLAAAARLSDELAAAASQLSGAGSSVRLVVPPRRGAVTDARAQVTAWALQGHLVRELIVNGVLLPEQPEAGEATWPPAWVAEHATQLAALQALAAEPGLAAQLRVLPQAAAPMDGAERLASLRDVATRLFGPLPGAHPVPAPLPPLLSVRDLGDPDLPRYELILALPLAEPDQVAAGRSGSDLVVTVAGLRRVLPLPSVLQRCHVVGGRFVGGRLILRFEPDERQWPRRQPRP